MTERDLFEAALDVPPQDRAAYLDGACGSDAALRQRLEALLSKQDRAGNFLELPVVAPLATLDEPSFIERAGTTIGPYKLLQQIGEGGFGIVFMAEQQEPIRRKVALKIIKPGMDSRQVIARFEAERQALALMDHPNIARILDGGTTEGRRSGLASSAEEATKRAASSTEGRPYFVMELVKGIAITDYCDQSQLTPRERLELFLPVCQAVQHAHQKGIIHRDLKPSNVLVTLQDGVALVKVIDFGIAKALGQQLTEKTLFTNFAQLIGTPLYMSPEQAGLSNVDVDTRSDVYSLGVLLYELLTGTTPFDKERLKEVGYDEMRRIIREEEPLKPSTRISTLGQAATTISSQRKSDPKRLRQLLKGELDWIVVKCLEKDRSRRYESAGAVAADVQRHLRDEPVQACPPSVAYRLRKFVRRNKVALAMASIVAAALLFVAAGFVVSTASVWRTMLDLQRALDREQQTVYFQCIALAENELASNHGAHAEELLGGCREEQRGWEWHFLKRRLHEEPLLLTEHMPGSGVQGVAFNPSGTVLAAGCWDGKVRLWDPMTGKLLRTFTGQPRGFDGVAFSRDGQLLAAANWDGTIMVCDLAANQQRVLKGHKERVSAVAFRPDGRQLASAGLDKIVILWNPQTSQKQMVLSGHTDDIHRVAYSPDGTRLATASDDQTARVWDVGTGQLLLSLTEHRKPVTDVTFSPDGGYLATASYDRKVCLWDATTGRKLHDFLGHSKDVLAVAFSPDGRRLASGGEDSTVRLWDPASGQETLVLRGHTGHVACLAFSPDGRRLASGAVLNLDFTVRVWNATPVEESGAEPVRTLAGHTQDVTCLAFSRDGQWLASGSVDNTIRVRRTVDGELVRLLGGGLTGGVGGVAFSPDGVCLAAVGDNGTLNAWQVQTGREVWGHARQLSRYSLEGVAYSPDGRCLAVADNGGLSVHILDAATGKGIAVLNGRLGTVNAVAYRPDGRCLAVASSDQTICLEDVSNLDALARHTGQGQVLRGHETVVESVAYRTDGAYLASAGEDGRVIVWDARGTNVKEARRFRAHHDAISGVAFSPEGRRLATASRDGTLKLWDAGQDCLLALIRAHQGEILAVAFHPDGRLLASAGADGTVKLWSTEAP
jgi:WD40 repeat protein/serine/threonine protein kinase